MLGFSKAIETFGQDRLKKNYMKMSLGFNHVLGRMFPQTAHLATTHSSCQVNVSNMNTVCKFSYFFNF